MDKSLLILLFLTLSITFCAFGQTGNKSDTTLANYYYSTADTLQREADFKGSVPKFELAAEIYKNEGIWKKYFLCLERASESYWRIREFKKAEDLILILLNQLDTIIEPAGVNVNVTKAAANYNLAIINSKRQNYSKALAFNKTALTLYRQELGDQSREVGHIMNSIANVYSNRGVYDSAIQLYKEAIEVYKIAGYSERINMANTYYNISDIYSKMGSYDLAQKALDKTLEIYKARLGPQHPSLAFAYNGMGINAKSLGSGKLAIEYFERALNINRDWYGEKNLEVADGFANLGVVYNLDGQYDKALKHLLKAMEIRKQLVEESDLVMASTFRDIGLVFANKGQYDLALDHYHKALNIMHNKFVNGHPDISVIDKNIGDVYRLKHEYDVATRYYDKAINYNEVNPFVVDAANELASMTYDQKKYRQSLHLYQHALILNITNFNDTTVYSNPTDLSKNVSQICLLESLLGKAAVYEQLYFTEKEDKHLSRCIEILRLCDTLIDNQKQSYVNFEDKLKLLSSYRKLYEMGIRISLLMYQHSQESQFLHQAYYFLEKSNAAILSESIGSITAKQVGLIPDSLYSYEQAIKSDKNFYQSQIVNLQKKRNQGGDYKAQLENNKALLFKKNRKYDSLVEELEKKYPDYYQLKYNHVPIKPDELQKRIQSNTALIQYFVGEDHIYQFMITQNDIKVFSVENYDRVIKNVEALNSIRKEWAVNEQEDKLFDRFVAVSYQLYQDLLESALHELKNHEIVENLVIDTDDLLSYIPFELLLTNPSFSIMGDYTSLNYLVKDYSISYAHSATLNFRKKVINSGHRATKEFLGYAPLYETAITDSAELKTLGKFRDAIIALKWNGKEVQLASNYLEGEERIGENATESNFKDEAHNYNIIHLAMHALIDHENPMLSKLVFNRDKQDTLNDGYLYAYELLNMEMSPELVVLSACNTGVGKLQKGTGLSSLGYAFSYAGCRSVIVSKWQVDDKSTSILMKHFYKNLSDGMDKAQALRYAKLEFMKDPTTRYSNPLYWAGFVIIGDNQAINTSEVNYVVLTILFLVLLLAIYVLLKRRNLI